MLIDPLEQKIIELRKKGHTYHEIKKQLNCTLMTVQKTCFKNGISTQILKLSDDKIEQIKKVYAETKSQRKTAEIVGCSKTTVGEYLSGKRYDRNKESAVQNVINWRKRTKKKLVEYKGGKCTICSYDRCINALEFHHLDPNEKDFTIAGKSWSFERLKGEVDKCVLLCSNCHKEVEYGIIVL